ncbi:MAG: gamma-glutamyltransferase [Porphyromonadaceae bacterium]|nr:MAG: gamma-glutamyltransferase [Porphyromonadaceae bacterium]
MKGFALKQVSMCLVGLMLINSCSQPNHKGLGPTGEHGMVVTAHPDASRIGLTILQHGGNAMDAAVAVEFALAVCYPAAGNIAGGGFWVLRTSGERVYTLDYREKAPMAATKDMYLGPDGEVVQGLSTQTILASGVPGTVDGMVRAHEKFGSLPWRDVVQPAVDMARKGFPLTKAQAADLNSIRKILLERNSWNPVFVRDSAWKEGDLLIQPDLANTLERIRDSKRDGFYSGQTADYIIGQMQESGGLITYKDLQDYQSVWREPITGYYRDYRFYSMAPPSSGGVALKQLLGIISKTDIKSLGYNSVKTIHYMVEAEKRVYADRAEYLGDPSFVNVPVAQLTNAKYLSKRAADIKPNVATPSDSVRAGTAAMRENLETTHYSIADRWGNAVAATTTLNGGFGCRIVVKGGGFFLNNEMDDFSSKPGSPNIYGLIGNEANAIAPGKRMLSCMTPTLVTKNDKMFMVVGSPGGSTIITSVFQTILNVIDHGMTMQEAVSAKRFHHQWLPDLIQYEPEAIDSLTVTRLTAMGHHLKKIGKIGRVDAILFWPDGKMEGGADPRGDDTARGF